MIARPRNVARLGLERRTGLEELRVVLEAMRLLPYHPVHARSCLADVCARHELAEVVGLAQASGGRRGVSCRWWWRWPAGGRVPPDPPRQGALRATRHGSVRVALGAGVGVQAGSLTGLDLKRVQRLGMYARQQLASGRQRAQRSTSRSWSASIAAIRVPA